jgi:hypothetical protein
MGVTIKINHKLTVWTAIIAMVAMMLAPPLSHLFFADSVSEITFDVCSAVIDSQVDSAHSDKKYRSSTMACPYCSMHVHFYLPIRNEVLHRYVFIVRYLEAHLFYLAPQTLFAWIVSSPRAPPFVA